MALNAEEQAIFDKLTDEGKADFTATAKPAPKPPLGWIGAYLEEITSPATIIKWIEHEETALEFTAHWQGNEDRHRVLQEVVRNALLIVSHLRLDWKPPEGLQSGPWDKSDGWRLLNDLKNWCCNPGATETGMDMRPAQRAEPAKPARKAPTKKLRITVAEADERMKDAIEEDPDRMRWTTREWKLRIGCSTSTISQTDMYKHCVLARERAKQEKAAGRRWRRRPRHHSQA